MPKGDGTTLVTDKQFYLDTHLKSVLELCFERWLKKWDNLIIIDGLERAGKTTLGKTSGYYYAWLMSKHLREDKVNFSVDNVFFDIDEMIEYANTHRNQVIIWDEAALGGLSLQWQDKIQQKLLQMLMIAGKYGHFYIFIIPSFFKLNWYLAVHRSLCLLHVYSPDKLTRGLFTCLNDRQKQWVYNNNKKSGMYTQPTFEGRFTLKNTQDILNEEAYEAKKDAAIRKYMNAIEENKDSFKVKKLKWVVANKLNLEEAQKLLNISKSTYFEWKKIDFSMLSNSVGKSVVLTEKGNEEVMEE
ncbi:MAG: hypothetical protein QW165_04520 [Candidatus Woesearchaeota archaeon]